MAFASVAAITLLLRLRRRLFSCCSEAGDDNNCGGNKDISSPKDVKIPDKESNNVDETSPDSDPLSENLLLILKWH